jgi:hypothetical protein
MKTALVLALMSSGCGILAFDVSQDLQEQRISGSPLGGILPNFLQAPIPITINLSAETQKRDTGPAKSANLKAIRFRSTPHEMPSGNFDFVDEIHIHVSSPNDPTLPKKEIARLAPVGNGQTTIELEVFTDVDLLPYINKGAEISATASGTQPTKDFTYDGQVTITVHI